MTKMRLSNNCVNLVPFCQTKLVLLKRNGIAVWHKLIFAKTLRNRFKWTAHFTLIWLQRLQVFWIQIIWGMFCETVFFCCILVGAVILLSPKKMKFVFSIHRKHIFWPFFILVVYFRKNVPKGGRGSSPIQKKSLQI